MTSSEPSPQPARTTPDLHLPADVQLARIRLVGLPLAVQARAQEHSDELTRELMLIGEQMRQQGDHAGLPARLVGLIEQLTAEYSAFTGEQEQQVANAMAAGAETIDLDYEVPSSVADAAHALIDILAEADDYCRAGEHLLTLPTPPDLVTYREWFLEEFVRQVAGHPPIPFAQFRSVQETPEPADEVPAPHR
jgi:hypothetical protein